MEFVVKIRTSEGEQKKFKLISFTHWQFIVSYHKAVANLKINSKEKQKFSEKISGSRRKWPVKNGKVNDPENGPYRMTPKMDQSIRNGDGAKWTIPTLKWTTYCQKVDGPLFENQFLKKWASLRKWTVLVRKTTILIFYEKSLR